MYHLGMCRARFVLCKIFGDVIVAAAWSAPSASDMDSGNKCMWTGDTPAICN